MPPEPLSQPAIARKSARAQGSRLLTNADISEAIESGQTCLREELKITALDKRARLWDIAMFNTQTFEDQHGKLRMRDPRAATSAIAELNKMDGSYAQAGQEHTPITFIQHFGQS